MYWTATLHRSDVSTGFEVLPVETICKSKNRYESLNKIMGFLSELDDEKVSVHRLGSNEFMFVFSREPNAIECLTLTKEKDCACEELIKNA